MLNIYKKLFCTVPINVFRLMNIENGHEDSGNTCNFLELIKLQTNDNNILNRYFLWKEQFFRYATVTNCNESLNIMAANIIKNII